MYLKRSRRVICIFHMDLNAAHDILLEHSTPDNARYFKIVYQHYNKRPESSLKDYLLFVEENTSEWLNNLPQSLKTRPALAKPKTAINVLLAMDKVKDDVGADCCKRVETKLTQTFKNAIGNIVANRNQTPTAAPVEATPSEDNSDNESCSSERSSLSDDAEVHVVERGHLGSREAELLQKIKMLKQCILMLVDEQNNGRSRWVKLLLDNI